MTFENVQAVLWLFFGESGKTLYGLSIMVLVKMILLVILKILYILVSLQKPLRKQNQEK